MAASPAIEPVAMPSALGRPPFSHSMAIQTSAAVLAEIDQTARATFASITIATMLGLIERQQRAATEARAAAADAGTPAARSRPRHE